MASCLGLAGQGEGQVPTRAHKVLGLPPGLAVSFVWELSQKSLGGVGEVLLCILESREKGKRLRRQWF